MTSCPVCGKENKTSFCQTCSNRKYKQNNKDKISEQGIRYRERYREKLKEKSRKYYQENAESLREKRKEYAKSNKEKISARNKKYREKNKEVLAEYHKKHYEQNKEEYLKKSAEYRSKNKELISQRKKEYYKSAKLDEELRNHFKEKGREYSRRRRAAKTNNGYEPYNEMEIVALYGTDCHLCLEEIDMTASRKVGESGWEKGFHVDHVVPLSLGGSDALDNVRPAHGFCNLSKGAKSGGK